MKKTGIKENRKLAWAALALVVIASVLGIGGAKIKGLGREAEQFYNANMASDMVMRTNAAKAIVQVGESALDQGDTSLKAAQGALKAMEKAGTPKEIFAANADLTSSIGMLYETLHKTVNTNVGSVLKGQWEEFGSRQNIMNNQMGDYTKTAQRAQEAVSGFPASLIAKLVGMPV
ncbi:MAG: hypothetical protein RR951_01690 [Ruthenibacterium sp.]